VVDPQAEETEQQERPVTVIPMETLVPDESAPDFYPVLL
jgi:hypothetical protein